MKDGSYLINNARGTVVDIPAMIEASRSGKLAGAAIDVFPNEPAGNGDYFSSDLNSWTKDLVGLKNIILTPHIGGSTEEAQSAIGVEVSTALVRYVNEGTTLGAVNLPEVNLRSLTLDQPDCMRVIYIHKNVPGVLRQVNGILLHHNIEKQMSDSRGDVAYLMADISEVKEGEIRDLFTSLEELSCKSTSASLCTVGLTANLIQHVSAPGFCTRRTVLPGITNKDTRMLRSVLHPRSISFSNIKTIRLLISWVRCRISVTLKVWVEGYRTASD